jgi:hypothetical protein
LRKNGTRLQWSNNILKLENPMCSGWTLFDKNNSEIGTSDDITAVLPYSVKNWKIKNDDSLESQFENNLFINIS